MQILESHSLNESEGVTTLSQMILYCGRVANARIAGSYDDAQLQVYVSSGLIHRDSLCEIGTRRTNHAKNILSV